MKLENSARCVEVLADLDALAAALREDDSCACGPVAAAVVSRTSVRLSMVLSPVLFGHASKDDLLALQALTEQLREQAAAGGGS